MYTGEKNKLSALYIVLQVQKWMDRLDLTWHHFIQPSDHVRGHCYTLRTPAALLLALTYRLHFHCDRLHLRVSILLKTKKKKKKYKKDTQVE